MAAGDEVYDGLPVVELPITEVDVPEPAHLRRSLRYGGEVESTPPRPSRRRVTSEA